MRWARAGRGAESVFVCAVGTGIGGAFVERGHLLLGAHGAATNIGHVTCADARGIPCQCGAVGHVETIAAGPGILERYLELGGAKTDEKGAPVDGAYISRAAEDGDEAAVAAETRSGRALGEVLGNMVNLFDPECVVLSGSVAKCGPVWHRGRCGTGRLSPAGTAPSCRRRRTRPYATASWATTRRSWARPRTWCAPRTSVSSSTISAAAARPPRGKVKQWK